MLGCGTGGTLVAAKKSPAEAGLKCSALQRSGVSAATRKRRLSPSVPSAGPFALATTRLDKSAPISVIGEPG